MRDQLIVSCRRSVPSRDRRAYTLTIDRVLAVCFVLRTSLKSPFGESDHAVNHRVC
jgi:hypothetical protein